MKISFYNYPTFFSLLLIGMVLFSCEKGEGSYTVVDVEELNNRFKEPEFIPYVDSFIEEAAKRGITLDVGNISMVFVDDVGIEDAVGVCTGGPVIEIEQNYWNNTNDCLREFIIFHELGHCELKRGHRNDTINNKWISLMRGMGDGFPNPDINGTKFQEPARTYYIDELFDIETLVPDWFSESFSTDFFGENAELVYSNNSINYDEILMLELPTDNYRIDIKMDSVIGHGIIPFPEGDSFNVESIVISNQDENIIFDLFLNKLIIANRCSSARPEAVEDKISIINEAGEMLIFYDEVFVTAMDILNAPLTLKTDLVSGIKRIDVYEIKDQ